MVWLRTRTRVGLLTDLRWSDLCLYTFCAYTHTAPHYRFSAHLIRASRRPVRRHRCVANTRAQPSIGVCFRVSVRPATHLRPATHSHARHVSASNRPVEWHGRYSSHFMNSHAVALCRCVVSVRTRARADCGMV